jgi:peptidoglycan hydrolase-like protein with peptidoglycan-binding domain
MIRYLFIVVAILIAVSFPVGKTRAATVDEMLVQIQALMTQIETLQAQLQTVRGELSTVLKTGLREGMSDDDIKKIQEVLATDPSIYPEGMITGYYGRLTVEALMRFQTRHGLPVTGELDTETKALLETYLAEKFGDRIPPGLLRAPGIMKKVELRYREECENSGHGKDPFCMKLRVKYDDDSDDDSDDSDDDSDDDSSDDGHDVEIEIEDNETTAQFVVDAKKYTVTISGVDAETLLKAVSEKLDTSVDKLSESLVEALLTELDSETEKDSDDDDDDGDDD